MRHTTISLMTCAALALPGAAATGQSVASRVNAIGEGDVRLTFPLKPGICGWGSSWSYSGRNGRYERGDNRYSRDIEYDVDCNTGPGRLVVVRRDGETVDLRFYVGKPGHDLRQMLNCTKRHAVA